ncbi:MFS transporter [Saccharopolyspora griseoalba]|uniref:MFS transporter n=1 Tax=Saccharopolyspora griseoalba TaxID=1431848 RepID=A0ABW2LM39_9PSEU
MLRPYRLLASVPHVPSVLTACLAARLYQPAQIIVLTFLVAGWTGSYAAGGAAAAAKTVGQAIASPVRGRQIDRRSAPKVLVLTGAGAALGFTAMAAVAHWVDPARWWLIVPVALGTGLMSPPLGQVGRAMWPRLADGEAREAAYAVEATLQELLFVTGPVLAAFVVAAWGPKVAMLGCAGWALLGTTAFAAALWRAGLRGGMGGGEVTGRGPRLWRLPGFVSLLGFCCLIAGALIAADVLLVGWARERGQPELAGLLAAVWAVGSLAGGLVAGGLTGKPRLGRRSALVALGMCALVPVLPPVSDPGSPLLVGVILLAGGFAIAPTFAASNSRLAELTPAHRRGEAFGWAGTAMTLGGSASSPLVGAMLDLSGPAAGAAVLAGLAVAAALLVAWHLHRTRGAPSPVAAVGSSDRPADVAGDLPR